MDRKFGCRRCGGDAVVNLQYSGAIGDFDFEIDWWNFTRMRMSGDPLGRWADDGGAQ
jgi:hypothetical protein